MISELSIQILLQVILPVFFVSDLLRSRTSTVAEWLGKVGFFGLVVLLVVLTARWDWTSYYLRAIVPAAVAVAVYVSYHRIETHTLWPKQGRVGIIAYGLLVVGLLGLNLHVLSGYVAPPQVVELSYPLKGATYYVGGGGANRWINGHHVVPPQDYALDIVRLNAFGNRAAGVWPDELDRFAIYGDSIYSPCTGRVVRAVDGNVDQMPPARDWDNVAGNHVLIACKGVEVLLAHMQEGSLTVQSGARVRTGDVLGQVGNSGNTTQPHLHIHVEKGGASGSILDGTGVAATYGGRFLVRNSLFRGGS